MMQSTGHNLQFTRYNIHETGIRVDGSGYRRKDSKYRIIGYKLVYLYQDTGVCTVYGVVYRLICTE